jgi:hypothetical protein
MNSQQQADASLARWQELRSAGLTPDQRIAALMADFWQPPIDLYEDTLRIVAAEMERA